MHDRSYRPMTARVMVTGASGFVGREVVAQLLRSGREVTAALRGSAPDGACATTALRTVQVADLASATDWRAALAGVDVIVHCAARVHVMRETAADPMAAFRQVNVDGTLQLAKQAVAAGVRRFVFISSIGVNGAETFGTPFKPDDLAAAHSAYARSKHEAELGLLALAGNSPLEVVIIRPPLVFGPGAPGNFERLMRALQRGFPLPFGAVHNRRSLVALRNLVSLIEVCLDHPAAANQVFLVSDGDDISTTELLRRVATALGTRPRLLRVPAGVLKTVAGLIGRAPLAQQLCGSLQVDISKTRTVLGWAPVIRLDKALDETAREFLARAGA